VEEIAEGTRFLIDGQVFTYVGDGEDAAGQPVAHLRGGDSDSLEEYPRDALQSLERAESVRPFRARDSTPRAARSRSCSHARRAYPRPGTPTRGWTVCTDRNTGPLAEQARNRNGISAAVTAPGG
jgi:hypothetical protein